MPTALITGIAGQDGSYLTELLLQKGYLVHGLMRSPLNSRHWRIEHLVTDKKIFGHSLFLHQAELADMTSVRRILTQTKPDEIYHLAAQTHVGLSFEMPELTCDSIAMGTLRLLEIVRDLNFQPKFLLASSSEIFGKPTSSPQTEDSPKSPVNPYGIAKAFATQMVRVYRDTHKLYACNAICYNHESPRRTESFVTRKIAKAVVAIARKEQDQLILGNINVLRDWGYAPEYVEAMWRMLQHATAEDYIIATGHLSSLKDFLQHAFQCCGLNWQDHVVSDAAFFRPDESSNLVGDPTKAERQLSWRAITDVKQLAEIMINAELTSQHP